MDFLNTDFLKNDKVRLVVDELREGDGIRVPAYRFFIQDNHENIVGKCDLRIGYNERLYYGGHIGYTVYEEFRGHRYASEACRLLFALAKKHGMEYLYITCNPDNLPSRRTCELLNGELTGIVELPEDNDMRINKGETQKCIFKFIL